MNFSKWVVGIFADMEKKSFWRILIPNLFTSLNLVCGILGIILTFETGLAIAFFFMLAAVFFDFFDGLLARALKVKSEFGKQLDSLADVVSFGALPGIMLFHYISISRGQYFVPLAERDFIEILLPSFGLLVAVFSALRLAKFNIDTKQSNGFLGLPTPANALMIGSLGFIMDYQFNLNYYYPVTREVLIYTAAYGGWDRFDIWVTRLFFSSNFHYGLVLLSCTLLVSRIPLFSLKLQSFGFKVNQALYIYLISMVILIALNFLPYFIPIRRWLGLWPEVNYLFIPFGIIWYIVVSLLHNFIIKKNEI